jgi:sulfur transfer complex TusBCD TusB component (DsrH family)
MVLQQLFNVIFYNNSEAGTLMLHITDTFPIHDSFLEKTHSGDTIILKDNAVLAVKQENITESLTRKTFAHLNLCVSKTDLLLRNIVKADLIHGVSVLDNIEEYQDDCLPSFAIKSLN